MNLLAVNVFVGGLSAYQLKRKWECVRVALARVHSMTFFILFTFLFAVMRTANSSRAVCASTHSNALVIARSQRTQWRARDKALDRDQHVFGSALNYISLGAGV
jgi:hypothetical protein